MEGHKKGEDLRNLLHHSDKPEIKGGIEWKEFEEVTGLQGETTH